VPDLSVPTSIDAIFDGRIIVEQPRDGYRFTIDSLALAARVARHRATHVLDVGAGVGVISLATAALEPAAAHIDAVEVDPTAARLLARNIDRNGLSGRIAAIHADVRGWAANASAHRRYGVIAVNPPYFSPARSRAAVDPGRAAARHELHGGIEEIVASTSTLLDRRGAFEVVYPARGLARLLAAFERVGLRRVSLRPVHAVVGRDAYVVLATARPGRESIVVLEPGLVLSDELRAPTDEARALASGVVPSHPASSEP
jgi:tRNA1(Val) A37 N6-methylase TrmN6